MIQILFTLLFLLCHSNSRGDPWNRGGAQPPSPGGVYRQTDQGVQDRQ